MQAEPEKALVHFYFLSLIPATIVRTSPGYHAGGLQETCGVKASHPAKVLADQLDRSWTHEQAQVSSARLSPDQENYSSNL